MIHERPDVFNHNVETVPRLYPMARRGSQFLRSARVLRMAKEMGGAEVVTKSGLMVGLGESFEEMVETFGLLREHRVQVLTVGQYLRPTENHLPVDPLLAPGGVRGAGEGRLRAGLRVGRRRPAGPLQLPRGPEPAGAQRAGRLGVPVRLFVAHGYIRRTGRTAGGDLGPPRWSQPGSNRRPPPCKGGALPAELWPLAASVGRRGRGGGSSGGGRELSRRSRSPWGASARTRAGRPRGPPRGSRGSPQARPRRWARAVVLVLGGRLGRARRCLAGARPAPRLGLVGSCSSVGSLSLGASSAWSSSSERRFSSQKSSSSRRLVLVGDASIGLGLVHAYRPAGRPAPGEARRSPPRSAAPRRGSDSAAPRAPPRRRTFRSAVRRSPGALRWRARSSALAARARALRRSAIASCSIAGASSWRPGSASGAAGASARGLGARPAARRLLQIGDRERRRGPSAAAGSGCVHEFGRRLGKRIGGILVAGPLGRAESLVLELFQLGVVRAMLPLQLQMLFDRFVENAHRWSPGT